MTGTEYWGLSEKDVCILTEDITTYGLTWHKGDKIIVAYRNTYEELKNIYENMIDNFPYYQALDKRTCERFNLSEVIDCKTNEDLFLAIAAFRDDSDYMQWFVCNEDHLTHQMNEYKIGDFQLCKDNKSFLNKILPSWHKATVSELIEHFK